MTGLLPIRPTLYIGLGGTGKEVLLRLRRRVCDEFGTQTLPWTRFLYIDCDDSAMGVFRLMIDTGNSCARSLGGSVA